MSSRSFRLAWHSILRLQHQRLAKTKKGHMHKTNVLCCKLALALCGRLLELHALPMAQLVLLLSDHAHNKICTLCLLQHDAQPISSLAFLLCARDNANASYPCLVQLASAWWSNRVKSLQRDSGLMKRQVTGMAVLEAVPEMPDYWWPADPALRQVGSGGQGIVY